MGQTVVLLYHRVETLLDDYNYQAVTPDNFRTHINFLKNNYQIITPDEIYNDIETDEDRIVITFDDGYYDFYTNAMPILKEYNVPATLFVSTENIDKPFENWTDNILRIIFSEHSGSISIMDEKINNKWNVTTIKERKAFYQDIRKLFLQMDKKDRDRYTRVLENWANVKHEGRIDRRILRSDEIYNISKENFITLGSHTCSHPSLRCLEEEEQIKEIVESKKILEEIIKNKIKYFSYPFGSRDHYSEKTIEIVKHAGYKMAFSVSNSTVGTEKNCYEIPRCPVGNYGETEFESLISNIFSSGIKIDMI